MDPILRRNNSYTTSVDVWKFIKDLGISKVELSTGDIESILDTLVYDGRVEKHVVCGTDGDGDNKKLYRAIEPLVKSTGSLRMPCGLCPVIHDCQEGGVICPSKCVYLKEWFDM